MDRCVVHSFIVQSTHVPQIMIVLQMQSVSWLIRHDSDPTFYASARMA
jgi:hypothetical protein